MLTTWIQDTTRRIFPSSSLPPGDFGENGFRLILARGERRAFQVGVRNGSLHACRLSAEILDTQGLRVRLRRIGYVPLRHLTTDTDPAELDVPGAIPGFVPDPLHDDPETHLGPLETGGFWIDVQAPEEMPAGNRSVCLLLKPEKGEAIRHTAAVTVAEMALPAREGLPVTHWLYLDAIADWYGVSPLSDPFWEKVNPYLENLVGHGNDTLFTPFLAPPVNGDNRPIQLLGIWCDEGRYRFDWSELRRWVARGKEMGFRYFEWSHLFSQWGAKYAPRVYEGFAEEERAFWPLQTPGLSGEYRDFLSQLFPEWKRFLIEEEILDRSFFHLSDEPNGKKAPENYRAVATFVREKAPWLNPTEAVEELPLVKEGYIGQPVCSVENIDLFLAEGIRPWAYYCCNPRGPWINRFLDTPLWKIRMVGWLLHRTGAGGFLHWGYNYWSRKLTRELVDPFSVSDAGRWPAWPSGDPFMVYPGPEGPLDSIRWEIFAESLQDYALLQAGGSPEAGSLEPLRSFKDFPRDPPWIEITRESLLCGLPAGPV